MKHQHWSFKANTETFDGRRAVKEAWAAGLQVVTFTAGDASCTLATEDAYKLLYENDIDVEISENGRAGLCRTLIPTLSAEGVRFDDVDEDGMPPYVYALDAHADEVRGMIAQLRKPRRVA